MLPEVTPVAARLPVTLALPTPMKYSVDHFGLIRGKMLSGLNASKSTNYRNYLMNSSEIAGIVTLNKVR